MMSLLAKIEADLTDAAKSKDEKKTSILRYLLAQIHNAQIAKGKDIPLTDNEIQAEIAKEAKRHRKSIEAFERAGRQDLTKKEKKELAILENYLPTQLSETEIEKIVSEAIRTTEAASPSDFGKVMGVVMSKIVGRASGTVVAQIVKRRLAHST